MFKASGLQRYIFATNKLREVVGGSQMIAHLAGKYLDTTLDELGFERGRDVQILQQAAGQATLLFHDETNARHFYAIWPVLVSQLAPGLETHQWMGEVEEGGLFDTLKAGWQALRALRNISQPAFPELTPPVLRAARTSGAAVGVDSRDKQRLDRPSRRKLDVERQNQAGLQDFEPGDVRSEWMGCKWAADLQDIVRGEQNYLGVIHADGNRLGGFLIELANSIDRAKQASAIDDDRILSLYREFSSGLAGATRQAALDALGALPLNDAEMMDATVPARPVVVGGDDVTLIVPAARAVGVTAHFLRRFETLSSAFLAQLAQKYRLDVFDKPLARRFTACAGIIYQRWAQPLLTSYENAEALCAWAKSRSRLADGTTAGTLLFARTIDSSQVDFRTRLARDFVDPQSGIRLTAGPYSAAETPGFVSLATLANISSHQGQLSHGSIRGVIDALHQNAQQAQWALERLVAVHGDEGAKFKQQLEQAGAVLTQYVDSQEQRGGSTLAGMALLADTSIMQFVEGK